MPAGVHGTGPGIPSASRPMFSGCIPSLSLSGSISDSAASKSTCGGVGCWKIIAVTAGSSLNWWIILITSAVVASCGRCACGLPSPSSVALAIFMPT